jgi:hypothetical protein
MSNVIEKCARAIDKALTKADKFGVPEREACQEAAKACLAALADGELDGNALSKAARTYHIGRTSYPMQENGYTEFDNNRAESIVRAYLQALTKGSGGYESGNECYL